MMEDPSTWSACEKLIAKTISEHHNHQKDGVIGYSLVRSIYNALKEGGYIMEIRKKYEDQTSDI